MESVEAAEQTKQEISDGETESSGGGETKQIIKLHTSEQAKEERDRQWDDVESVSYEFIKTGRSNNAAGILTTHDRSYKVRF